MRINILKLIDLYDSYSEVRHRHIIAINSLLGDDLILGILCHYLEGRGINVTITNETPSALHSRQRLSRWIITGDGGKRIFYQTLVRNWSVYNPGVPRTLTRGMSPSQLNRYAFNMYTSQWNGLARVFRDKDNVGKVMLEMNIPEEFNPECDTIRPLVCYWYPISNKMISRIPDHWFTLKGRQGGFGEADIFSTSIYLRWLAQNGVTETDIKLGHINTTLDLLRSFLLLRSE